MPSHREAAATGATTQNQGKEDLLNGGPFAPHTTSSSSSQPKSPVTPRTPVLPLWQARSPEVGRSSTGNANDSLLDLADFLATTSPPVRSSDDTAGEGKTTGKGVGGHVRTRSSGGKNRLVKRGLKFSGKELQKGGDQQGAIRKPPNGVEERVSKDGKKYLYITAGDNLPSESTTSHNTFTIPHNTLTSAAAPAGTPLEPSGTSRLTSHPTTTEQPTSTMAPRTAYARPPSSNYSSHSLSSHDGTAFPRSSNSTTKRRSRNMGLGRNSTTSKRDSPLGNMFSSLRERRSARSQVGAGEYTSGVITPGDDGPMPAAKERTASSKSSHETMSSNLADPLKSHPTSTNVDVPANAPLPTVPASPVSPSSPTSPSTTATHITKGKGSAVSTRDVGDRSIKHGNIKHGDIEDSITLAPSPPAQTQRVSQFSNPYVHHPTPISSKMMSLQEFLIQSSFDGAMPKHNNRLQPGPAPAVTDQVEREQYSGNEHQVNEQQTTNGSAQTNGIAPVHKPSTATNGSTYASASASRHNSRPAAPSASQNLSSRSSIAGAASDRRERTRARKLRDRVGSASNTTGVKGGPGKLEPVGAAEVAGERVLAPSPSFASERHREHEKHGDRDVVSGRAELGTDGGVPIPTATTFNHDSQRPAIVASAIHPATTKTGDEAHYDGREVEQTPETSPLSFKDCTPQSASGRGGALHFSKLAIGSDVPLHIKTQSQYDFQNTAHAAAADKGDTLNGSQELNQDGITQEEEDATPTKHQRDPPTSTTPTPSNNDPTRHLHVRLEHLERENRLLEAALMAVLKTSGKLNGCPCGRPSTLQPGTSTSGSETPSAWRDSSAGAGQRDNFGALRQSMARRSRSGVSSPAMGTGTGAQMQGMQGNARALEEEVAMLRRFRDERLLAGDGAGAGAGDRVSVASTSGSKSALDVYFATRDFVG